MHKTHCRPSLFIVVTFVLALHYCLLAPHAFAHGAFKAAYERQKNVIKIMRGDVGSAVSRLYDEQNKVIDAVQDALPPAEKAATQALILNLKSDLNERMKTENAELNKFAETQIAKLHTLCLAMRDAARHEEDSAREEIQRLLIFRHGFWVTLGAIVIAVLTILPLYLQNAHLKKQIDHLEKEENQPQGA
jgi:hypothetical protein